MQRDIPITPESLTGRDRHHRNASGLEQTPKSTHHRGVVRRVLKNIKCRHVLERVIGKRHLIPRQTQNLVRTKPRVEKPQCLLVVIQHHHAAMQSHLPGELPGPRSAVQEKIVPLRRAHAQDPSPHKVALTRVVPMIALHLGEFCVFSGIHGRKKPEDCVRAEKVSMLHLRKRSYFSLQPNRLKPSPAFLAVTLVLIAGAHSLIALLGMVEKSTTSDELAHITGGFTFNHWNDFRLHPENGLLPQRWQALPATISGTHFPDMGGEAWREADVWALGHSYFYGLGNNHEWMLFTARGMNTVFGLGTVLLVAAWARYLFGWTGAYVAVAFAALCPTLLAHSALATSDMAMAFFFIGSVSTFWWHLHDPRLRIGALSAFTFGLACVAKYTAVLLPPIFLVLALLRTANPTALSLAGRSFTSPGGRLGSTFASIAAHGAMAIVIVWAFFGFRFSAFNPTLPAGDFALPWSDVLAFGRWKAEVVDTFRQWRLLPEGFLYGLMFVLKHAEARGAFLDGEYSIFGWVSFFPKAFLYKTPPSLLLGLVVSTALVLAWGRQAGRKAFCAQLYRLTPLLLLFAIYWAFSLTSNLNIGHRHILPTYPVLYIATGFIGWTAIRAWQRSRTGGAAVAVLALLLVGWHAAESARIHPHHLAYFSPLVGGPTQGYKHLADSSLDWGQDLPGLKQWLTDNRLPGEPVFLSYFGTSEPDYYGIEVTRMPMIHSFRRARPWYWPEPGLYVLSATMLQHVYMPYRGDWTLENEDRYQNLRQNDGAFRAFQINPEARAQLLADVTLAEWNRAWEMYEQLRFARLCHYLRVRKPDAMIGYSLLIFRLNQAELDIAIDGSLRELAAALERFTQPQP